MRHLEEATVAIASLDICEVAGVWGKPRRGKLNAAQSGDSLGFPSG
jgi:hypothetical protein